MRRRRRRRSGRHGTEMHGEVRKEPKGGGQGDRTGLATRWEVDQQVAGGRAVAVPVARDLVCRKPSEPCLDVDDPLKRVLPL